VNLIFIKGNAIVSGDWGGDTTVDVDSESASATTFSVLLLAALSGIAGPSAVIIFLMFITRAQVNWEQL
jgi:hypothetical protein